jgi:hypothetical protein
MASDDPILYGKELYCAGLGIALNLDMDQPFSYTVGTNKGVEVKAQCNFTFPRFWKLTEEWRLRTILDSEAWQSPPLVMLPTDESEGLDSGGTTQIGLSDKTTYLLSNTDVDKATYTATAADVILGDLVDLGEREDEYAISLVNPPTRIIPTYDAHEGKRLEHVARIAADSGMDFYIGTSGQIIFIDMDSYSGTVTDTDWIASGNRKKDPTNEITSMLVIKTSKIQTEYEFVWAEKGAQTETIQAPGLTSDIDVYDESNIGYIAAAACYDNADPNQGELVKFVTMNPDDFEPGQIPTPTSSGPILSIVFDIRDPLQEELLGTIDARILVQGVPWGAVENEDITFETDEENSLVAQSYTSTPVTVSYTATEGGATLTTNITKYTMGGFDWYYYKGTFFDSTDTFELSFDCYEIISYVEGAETPYTYTDEERPADGYIDGVAILNQADADAVKKNMLYHTVRGNRAINYTANRAIFTMAAKNKISAWRRYPEAIIDSITIDNTSTKVSCFEEVWW